MKVTSLLLIAFFSVFSGCKSPEKTFPVSEPESTEYEDSVEDVINWRRSPNLQGWWNDPPNIRICSDTRVTKSRVESAIRWWERQGYSFGRIIVDDTIPCEGRMFEILFRLPKQSDFERKDLSSHLACTLTFRLQATSEIIRSEIFFINQADSNRPLMMEHELGHALGWQHVNSSYHIMNPEYNMTGNTARGVNHSDYIIRRREFIGDPEEE